MFQVANFLKNDDIHIKQEKGPFKVIEYDRDLSVCPETAQREFFMQRMGVRRRQLVCDLSQTDGVTMQAGAMQWMVGDVEATTGIKGAGDFIAKAMRGRVTGESAIKPEYVGSGTVVL